MYKILVYSVHTFQLPTPRKVLEEQLQRTSRPSSPTEVHIKLIPSPTRIGTRKKNKINTFGRKNKHSFRSNSQLLVRCGKWNRIEQPNIEFAQM